MNNEPTPVNTLDSSMRSTIALDSGRQMSVSRSNEVPSLLGKKVQFLGKTDELSFECWVDQTNLTAEQRFNQDFKQDAASQKHAFLSQVKILEDKRVSTETKDSIHLYEFASDWALNNLGLKGITDIETLADPISPEYVALLKKGFKVVENHKIKPEYLQKQTDQRKLALMRYVFPKLENTNAS